MDNDLTVRNMIAAEPAIAEVDNKKVINAKSIFEM